MRPSLMPVLVATVALVGAGCGDAGAGDPSSSPPGSTAAGEPGGAAPGPVTVAKGSDGPRRAGRVVARSAADWQAAWAEHGGKGAAPSVPPDVDFRRHLLVAVFLGQRPSAGFEVVVEAADGGPDGLRVRYAVVSPGPDCLTASVITFPFHVVAVEAAAGAVTFTVEERVKGCGP